MSFFADVCNKLCSGKLPHSVVFMMSPFGIPTLGPFVNFVIFCKKILSVLQMYVFVAPESALQTIHVFWLDGIMVSSVV